MASSMIRVLTVVLALGILGAGAWLRVVDLGARPMHADESVHAEKFRELWISGRYTYDPDEYHGPTIYYAALPVVMAAGRRSFADVTEQDLRLGVALVSMLVLLLPWMLVRELRGTGALIASALLALSPSLVFYSRYFIQEAFLALFTLGFLICLARYVETRAPAWIRRTGILAGLMFATKETAVFPLVTALVALPTLRSSAQRGAPPVSALHLLGALGTGVLVAGFLISGFFTNPGAVLDLPRSYLPWISRAHGTDLHQQPWFFYLSLMFWRPGTRSPNWTEGLLVALAVYGFALIVAGSRLPKPVPAPIRYIGWNALLLTLIYSAVPYKTPWCVLSLVVLYAVVGGYAASVLLSSRAKVLKAAACIAVPLGLLHMFTLAKAAALEYPADPRNPYVYAHTSPDLLNLVERVKAVAAAQPEGLGTTVQVVHDDRYIWPLPWYLRDMPRVGYWSGEIPRDLFAPIVVASEKYDEELTRRLDPTHLMTGFFALRRGVHLQVWIEMEAWKRYLESRPRPTEHQSGISSP